MLEGVVECLVKRNLTTGAIAGRFCMILGDLTGVFATLIVIGNWPAWSLIALLGLIGLGFATYFVFRNTNLEYEYSYFEGEMRVDKIMGKATRKKLATFDFNKMDMMAPVDSPRFHNAQGMKAVNYSTRSAEDTTYGAILYNDQNEQVFLMFTPNEELMAALQRLAPRKIYEN